MPANPDRSGPPFFGYKQVEEAPYPMTVEAYHAWPREPGWKYELHSGMCCRLWRGPSWAYRGYVVFLVYQPSAGLYTATAPALPGCQAQLRPKHWAMPTGEEHYQALSAGFAAMDAWLAEAAAAGQGIPTPEVDAEEQASYDRIRRRWPPDWATPGPSATDAPQPD